MKFNSIINRYLLKEMLPPFIINVSFLLFIFIMTKILDITNYIVNYKISLLVVLSMLFYTLPFFLQFVIPMSLMIAVLLTFLRMSGDNEIIALRASGFSIYFLNKDNRVLQQLTVSADMLARMEHGETPRIDRLENLPQFANRIYAADRFFRALESVSEDVRRQAVPWPENLLKSPGRVSRVAISDEVLSGYIELGFELEEPTQTRVILFQGRDWAVARIRAVLEGETFESPITF